MDKNLNPETTNQSVREIMQMAKDSYNTALNQTSELMHVSYGITPAFLSEAVKWSLEDFDTLPDEEIKKIYETYFNGHEEKKRTEIEDMRKDLKDCKTLSNTAYQMKEQYKEVQDIYNDSVDEEWKRRNSKEYREATLKRIDEWKEQLKNMDPAKDARVIRDLRKKIEFLESTITLDFITDRIKHVEKEKASIMRQFFSEREGGYALERCAARSPKFGFDKGWYKFFFNLEENFLPEEYHAFNNLFLFNVMRFIGYQDPYDMKERGMVQAIVNSLTGLVYHKFADSDMENVIVSLIKEYDSYFEDQREKFMNDNTTRPNHPVRLEQSKKAEADRRNEILAAIAKFDFPIPDKVDEMSTKDLHSYFNDKMEEMVAANTKEKELHGDAEAVEEDGITKVRPTFLKDKYRNPVDLIDNKFYYFDGDPGYQEVFDMFKDHDIKIAYQMFELKNPDVRLDLYEKGEPFTEADTEAAYEEAKDNFWYFWKYVLKLDVNVASLLTVDCLLTGRHTVEETMRQSGKSTTSVAYALWCKVFHSEKFNGKIILLGRDALTVKILRDKFDKFANMIPFDTSVLEDAFVSFTRFGDVSNVFDVNPLDNDRHILVVDDLEFIEDIDTDYAALFSVAWEDMQIVGNSAVNDPALTFNWNYFIDVANLNRQCARPYYVDETTGHDFFRVVRDHALSDKTDPANRKIINIIEVYPKRIITNEEHPIWQSLIEGSATSFVGFLREIYCLHVTNDMAKQIQEDGDELTESFHPSYIEYIKSLPVDPVNQLKEKMNNEGTISVEDALAGEPLVAKKPE